MCMRMSSAYVRLIVGSGLALLGVIPVGARAQGGGTVSGTVTAAVGGAPLANARVAIPALQVAATTDASGRYTLSLPAAASGTVTLTARRIGYVPKTASVTLSGGSVNADFVLDVSATELAEVVVTALGVERQRSKLGTAQQQLNAGEINNTRAQNVVQQIEGKVAGVAITSPGTQGGSTNVIIRGQNSITGNNQPLFIVDGVAVSNANSGGAPFTTSTAATNTEFDYGNALSDLNPDDIEALSVLKGPNAAALYGSRAANGVILITTRKGRNTSGRMRTELNTNLTFENPAILPEFQNGYGQGSGGEFEWLNGAGD